MDSPHLPEQLLKWVKKAVWSRTMRISGYSIRAPLLLLSAAAVGKTCVGWRTIRRAVGRADETKV
eukprot:scaffold8374_cov175-Amphora_coffeaeformis.AAC.41